MSLKNLFGIKILFLVYIFFLIDFTLFAGAFGRDITNVINWSKAEFDAYVKTSLNVIPFETVKLMFAAIKHGNVSLRYFVMNIAGNFILLMPLSYFVPKLFLRFNKFWKCLIVFAVTSMVIELLQLAFLTGSCDIDDFILNVAGAAAAYPVLKLLPPKRNKNNY